MYRTSSLFKAPHHDVSDDTTEFPTRQPLNLRSSRSNSWCSLSIHRDALELCVRGSTNRVVSMLKEFGSTLLDMVGSTEESIHLLQHDVPCLRDDEENKESEKNVDPTKEVEGVAATT